MSEIYKQKEYEIRSKMEDIDTISGTFEDYVREVDRFVEYLLNDTKEINILRSENKRLNENNQAMQEEMARTWGKLDKKENIIKEVREYIENLENIKIKYVLFEEEELYASKNDFVKELLEILEKAGDEK